MDVGINVNLRVKWICNDCNGICWDKVVLELFYEVNFEVGYFEFKDIE